MTTHGPARRAAGRVSLIVAAALIVGLLHSWIVQAGANPIRLRPIESGPTVIPGATAAAGQAIDGDDPDDTEGPDDGDSQGELVLGLDISLEDAKALFDMGYPFVDARPPDEFDESHVQGAFYLTADMLTSGDEPPVLMMLDPSLPVVVYCTGGDCEASHDVVTYLQPFGYTSLHVMVDGFPAWRDAGYPTEIGPETRLEFEH